MLTNIRVGSKYSIYRPLRNSDGEHNGKYLIWPQRSLSYYSPRETVLALREFNQEWAYAGGFPPRDLEPFAVPVESGCPVIRLSDVDPAFFMRETTVDRPVSLSDNFLKLISHLEGTRYAGITAVRQPVDNSSKRQRKKKSIHHKFHKRKRPE